MTDVDKVVMRRGRCVRRVSEEFHGFVPRVPFHAEESGCESIEEGGGRCPSLRYEFDGAMGLIAYAVDEHVGMQTDACIGVVMTMIGSTVIAIAIIVIAVVSI